MPAKELDEIKAEFTQGLSQISQFWGFPKSMGAIFAVLYLSSVEMTLNEIAAETGFTKGAISTSIRTLARMGLVHRLSKVGDRKDYYVAESDFYKVIRSVLKGRENSEFSHAIDSVGSTLLTLQSSPKQERSPEWEFAETRVAEMKSFFDNLDHLVRVITALETMNQNTVQKVIGLLKK